MARASVVVGRGYCSSSKEQRKRSKLASIIFALLETVVLIVMLGLSGNDIKTDHWISDGMISLIHWMRIISIVIICIHTLIIAWGIKEFLWPNHGEKFSLTIQGSHERRPTRHRRTMYGVTVSDNVTIEYNRNPDGLLVYFRKVKEGSSTTGPYCQPLLLPLKGWFTFFQVLILLTLITSTIIYYIYCHADDVYDGGFLSNLGSYPSLLFILLIIASVLQVPVVMSSYYGAEDCGFCCPLLWVSYTRWFKHTNAYTELIQQKIQAKHGEKLKQEGDQLATAIRQNMQRVDVNGVTYRDVGPATTKRYQDQLVLLHLLLAQEHDQVCKDVFPEQNIEGKGVSFTLTADEIDTLNIYAKQVLDAKVPMEVISSDPTTNFTEDSKVEDGSNCTESI